MLINSEVDIHNRIQRTGRFRVDAPIEVTFPLFGPIEEMKWAEGWAPHILFGSTEIEEKMMFRTQARYADEPGYTWVITKYEPDSLIEYLVSSTERMWFVTVRCREVEKSRTEVEVTYCYTGFNEQAIGRNAESLEMMFSEDLQDWSRAINDFIKKDKD